jgi:hypothetical protein
MRSWAFAAVEIPRVAGIRIEELTGPSHHSLGPIVRHRTDHLRYEHADVMLARRPSWPRSLSAIGRPELVRVPDRLHQLAHVVGRGHDHLGEPVYRLDHVAVSLWIVGRSPVDMALA